MTFEGVYSVLPTPFTDRGELDEASLRRVVDLFIDKGANGLTALGVTGEVARLEDAERARVLDVVVAQAAGRVPVVAGTSAEGTRTCVAYSRQARASGAAAVMVSPPRMAKLNSDAVVRHYKALADAVDDADRRPGLSADFGLCDGAGAPRPHRARDSVGADDQARGSADAVQDRADPRAGVGTDRADLRRAWRRVPAGGADVGRDRRDDRLRVSRRYSFGSCSRIAADRSTRPPSSSIEPCR